MTKLELSRATLAELVEKRRFGVEYQPILNTTNLDLYAYEALARFFDHSGDPIRPDWVYAALHESPLNLFQVEYWQKQLQLSSGPANAGLFVNLDQDSYFACGVKGLENPFFQLFAGHRRGEVIVELIENTQLSDASKSLAMIDTLSRNGISTAIDDVCSESSLVSTAVIQLVNYIKLDKYVVNRADDSNFIHLVAALIDYAHQTGKKVVLEGVETEAHLDFARWMKVDLVQGFLFRNQFIYSN
jgi:EAL domain-containing protein (putative c-di-GMP-specific phosphodiesterase class I)